MYKWSVLYHLMEKEMRNNVGVKESDKIVSHFNVIMSEIIPLPPFLFLIEKLHIFIMYTFWHTLSSTMFSFPGV